MSEHRATIEWQRGGAVFDYESYSRNHTWHFENGTRVAASAAPEFLGETPRRERSRNLPTANSASQE
jgi:hypothetical protein